MVFDLRLGPRELRLLTHMAESLSSIATGLHRLAAAHEKLATQTTDAEDAAELAKDADALDAAAQRMRDAQGTPTP